MADKHSILKSIKVLLGLEEMPSPTYTLADGTPIEVSSLEVGGTVIVGDAPAPEGEHTLSDGQVITVDELGVITELKPKMEAPEPGDMGDVPPVNPEKPAETMTQATIEQMVKEAVKEAVGEQMKAYTSKMEKQEKANKDLIALMDEILKMPAVTPEPPKQSFKKDTPLGKTEKYGQILSNFQQLKSK